MLRTLPSTCVGAARRWAVVAAALMIVLVLCGGAYAESVDLNNIQFGSTGYHDGTITNSGTDEYVWAGQLTTNDGLSLFCTDLEKNVYLGQNYTYDRVLMNGRVGYLLGLTPATTAESAGLQLAIWELKYESMATDPYGILTGSFTGRDFGDALLSADQYLANSLGKTADYYIYTNGTSQDLVSPVPEPGTLFTLLPGALGAAALVYRRRK